MKTMLKDITIEIDKIHEAVLSLEQNRKGITKLPPVDAKVSLHDPDSAITKLRNVEEQIQHYKK